MKPRIPIGFEYSPEATRRLLARAAKAKKYVEKCARANPRIARAIAKFERLFAKHNP